MIVKYGDTVVMYGRVVNGNLQEDEVLVLGSEQEFVWLYSSTTHKIYRHNPGYIKDHHGRKVLFDSDFCKPMNDVFDEQGEPNSGIFWHASQAGRVEMTKLLKMFKLIYRP